METNRYSLFDEPADDDIVIDFLSMEEFLVWVYYPDGTLRFPFDTMEEAELVYRYAEESGKILGLVNGSLGYFTCSPVDIQPTSLHKLVKEACAMNKKKLSLTNELHLTKRLQEKAKAERKVLRKLYFKVICYDKWLKNRYVTV